MKVIKRESYSQKNTSKMSFFFSSTDGLQPLYIQLLRYLIVGGIAFIVDFSILYLLVNFLGHNYLIAAAISFMTGLFVNYLLSISWVFNRTPESVLSSSFLIFLVTGLVGLGLNEVLMFLFTHIIGLDYLYSKIIAVPIVLLWNFISRKYLVNRRGHV